MQSDIRDNLKSVIGDKGYIQAAVAHKADISPSKFSQILNKSRKLEANELFAICEAIEMSPMELKNYQNIPIVKQWNVCSIKSIGNMYQIIMGKIVYFIA